MNKQKILLMLENWKEYPITYEEWALWLRLVNHKALNWGKECKIVLNQENKFYCEKCQKLIE
jgi:hypothetical protein